MTRPTDELVTDRSGGFYNISDLNRVGEWIYYLAGLIADAGVAISVTAKRDWTMTDYPTAALMQTYLDDVAACRAGLGVLEGTPELPDSMALLTYSSANNIEKNLAAVEDSINRMLASLWGCGEIGCGET